MTTPLIVGAGVDTFIANVKQLDHDRPVNNQDLPPELAARLADWQELARLQQQPYATPYRFQRAPMLMHLGGSSTWKYIIRNSSLEIKFGARLHLGMLAKVILSSEYIWAQPTLTQALMQVQQFVERLLKMPVFLQTAQVDLCADVAGLVLPEIWERAFITKAISKNAIGEESKDREYFGGRKLETIQFSGHGRPIHAKLYNKVKEIQQRSKEKVWFFTPWRANGWDGETPVFRYEISFERPVFREIIIAHTCKDPDNPKGKHFHCTRIDSAYDVQPNLTRLWEYGTQEWLRMVTPQKTKNRTRWPTAPAWKLIQGAFDNYTNADTANLGPIIRKAKLEANLDRAEAAIAGYMSTYAAWDGSYSPDDDLSVVFSTLYQRVTERLEQRGIDFAVKVLEKRDLYSVESALQPQEKAE